MGMGLQRRGQVQAQPLCSRSLKLGEEVLMCLLLGVVVVAAAAADPTIPKSRKRDPLHNIEHPDVGLSFFLFSPTFLVLTVDFLLGALLLYVRKQVCECSTSVPHTPLFCCFVSEHCS